MTTELTTRNRRRMGALARALAAAIAASAVLSACSADAAETGPEISPVLVGNNVWLSPTERMWERTGESGLTLMRIGGTSYDDNVVPTVLIDAWVTQIRAIGAEPLIQVSRFGDPEDAAELVRHYNIDSDEPVTYWGIGNEPDCGATTSETPAYIASYFKPIAAAMKEVDPTIKIYGPDACDFEESMHRALFAADDSPADISGKIPGTDHYYVDGLAWHRYVGYPPGNVTTDGLTTAGFEDFSTRMQQTRALVDEVNEKRERTGDDELQWALTEFNALGEAVCSFENGQMFASIYGDLMKYGATTGATWSIAESNGSCSGTDFGFLDAFLNPRASYWHMQMVANYFTGFYIDAESSVPDAIRSYGALDREQGRMTVMLMNIDTVEAWSCRVLLSRPEAPEANGCDVTLPAGIDHVELVDLPAQSTTVLVFDLDGNVTTTVTYAKGDEEPTTVEVG